jgi:hypothetical protein
MGLELLLLGARTRYFTIDPLQHAAQPANHQITKNVNNKSIHEALLLLLSFFLSYLYLFILYVCTYITVCMYVCMGKKKVPKEGSIIDAACLPPLRRFYFST